MLMYFKYILLLFIFFFYPAILLHAQHTYPVLRSTGFHKNPDAQGFPSTLAKRPGEQHIRVLAIRAEFQQDTIATTTGNGLFLMDSDPAILVDPPPHNREFFEDHMEALRRYYLPVSGGKVQITYEVFPRESNEVYKLPRTMFYYGPSNNEELLDQR